MHAENLGIEESFSFERICDCLSWRVCFCFILLSCVSDERENECSFVFEKENIEKEKFFDFRENI